MKKLLIIEHEKFWIEYLRLGITTTNTPFHLTGIQNEKKALDALQQKACYDCIIMHYDPDLGLGSKLTRKLREAGFTQPVVGWGDAYQKQAEKICVQAGMDAYVERSHDLSKLLDVITTLIQG